MKRNYPIICSILSKLLISWILFTAPLCINGQHRYKNLTLNGNLLRGKKVEITYDPAGTPLSSSKEIYAVAKMFVKYGGEYYLMARDIELQGGTSKWLGTFQLSDSCVSFFILIKNNLDVVDSNNGKGYVFVLRDMQDKPLPGGSANMAYWFLASSNSYGITYDQKRGQALLEEEFKYYPYLKSTFISTYAKTIDFTDSLERNKIIQEADLIYENHRYHSIKSLEGLSSVYRKLGQINKAEVCMNLLLKKFPESTSAFQWRTLPYQEAFSKATELEEKLKIHQEMVQVMKEYMFSEADLLNVTVDEEVYSKLNQDEDLSHMDVLNKERYSNTIQLVQLHRLLNIYMERKELGSWFKLIDSWKYEYSKPYLYNVFAKKCISQDTHLDIAYRVITKAVDWSRENLDAPLDAREKSFSHSSYTEIKLLRKKNYANYLVTHAKVLQKKHKTQESLRVFREALAVSNRLEPQINEQFVEFLIELEMLEEAQKEIKKAMRIDKYTSKMKKTLEGLKKGGNVADAMDSTTTNESIKSNLEIKKRSIAATIQNTPAPDFELLTFKGDTVQLSNLRGKVVILDFWATWCMPCIASFPGMQEAMKSYKNNPKVEFLFINLDEREVRGKIKKLVYKDGYDFNVLMDQKNVTAPAYSVHGIPVKFVIDPKGIIRFREGGFKVNTKDEVEELSIMIDIALNI